MEVQQASGRTHESVFKQLDDPDHSSSSLRVHACPCRWIMQRLRFDLFSGCGGFRRARRGVNPASFENYTLNSTQTSEHSAPDTRGVDGIWSSSCHACSAEVLLCLTIEIG